MSRILIPGDLDARITKAAQRRRVSKAEWVRSAIEQALDTGLREVDPLQQLESLGVPTGDIEQMLADIKAGA